MRMRRLSFPCQLSSCTRYPTFPPDSLNPNAQPTFRRAIFSLGLWSWRLVGATTLPIGGFLTTALGSHEMIKSSVTIPQRRFVRFAFYEIGRNKGDDLRPFFSRARHAPVRLRPACMACQWHGDRPRALIVGGGRNRVLFITMFVQW